MNIRVRGYTRNGIYNYKRGAYIANNFICIDVISIISKGRRKYDDISINIRGYNISIVYNYERGTTAINTHKRKEKIRIKV